ncbi:MAG: class I SAM-dependent methyltransferase [Candidatus Wallbacteria bacterium]|nr:class I SAM-dependent methyltransferase [Candidatus Wallbacteria bacterium]
MPMDVKDPAMDKGNGIECWLDEQELAASASSEYWNDTMIEQGKDWWCEKGSDGSRLMDFLEQSGFLQQFRHLLQVGRREGLVQGHILDAAAGVCWTSALLSREPQVEQVEAMDFSRHRIELIAPNIFELFRADPGKIRRVIGSFYHVARPDGFYDLIVLCQAFHHAEQPELLLNECSRVLKPGGVLLLACEPYIPLWRYAGKTVLTALKKGRIMNFSELYPADAVTGDQNYLSRDYRLMLRMHGFNIVYFQKDCRHRMLGLFARKESG